MNLDSILSTMNKMTFTNIEAKNDGGVIFFESAKSLKLTEVTATNFKSTTGEGAFLSL